jgi:F-type H+-transporting ATPase subunit c
MKKVVVSMMMCLLVCAVFSTSALASDEAEVVKQATPESVTFFAATVIAAALCIAIAAALCGLAQGRAIDKSMEALARQPEVSADLRTNLIIGLAFIESLAV